MGSDEEGSIPTSHPRYDSLVTRHRIEEGVEKGITSQQGLIAQGRGEAFDYLLGEKTIPSAGDASRAAAAQLLVADHPVISVNGNAAALVPEEIVELAVVVEAGIEVNLFNRSEERISAIRDHLVEFGAENVMGLTADARIPGLDHGRGFVDRDGIYSADVVLVPLEDGDRAEALRKMGKIEIVIDLNPLSRSAVVADIPIVDNIIRAFPNMIAEARELADLPESEVRSVVREFDRKGVLEAGEQQIRCGRAEASSSVE